MVGRMHILGSEDEYAELALFVNNDEQEALEDLMTVRVASTFWDSEIGLQTCIKTETFS